MLKVHYGNEVRGGGTSYVNIVNDLLDASRVVVPEFVSMINVKTVVSNAEVPVFASINVNAPNVKSVEVADGVSTIG